ncbi:hypothetical protein IWW36_002165 [Coemansia brasiliensis]|uniref:Uncharacterized protein n=1 Tax=Coemansia brasiliensis TaxID=2650707 RepID=A0A9W8IGG0_9FUNG|nr:hypothetical protein IWW36_002165 [Coemansia brasiliensis]
MKRINLSASKLLATKQHVLGWVGHYRYVATASLASLPNDRYQWTKERDKLLVELVTNKGDATWADIAKQLGIKGDPGKARSRWKVLQPKEHTTWTGIEDRELHQAIKDYMRAGNAFGQRGMWVYVAKQLTTNRSPQQCHSRWTNALLPRQGKVIEYTRFERIRGWLWHTEELVRLEKAIRQIKNVQDSASETILVTQKEPWLLPDDVTQGNRMRQYWMYVASRVRTRTPMQCRRKWVSYLQNSSSASISIEEVKRLAELVKSCGSKWKFLAFNYFPGKEPKELCSAYRSWQRIERIYKVDLLQIDPFARLQGYNGRSAWRPTGKDGFYDPNGQLVRVSLRGKMSILAPYVLACMHVIHPKRRPRSVGLSLWSAFGGKKASPEVIDQLVAALVTYGNDWISISRSLNMPMLACRRLAENLSTKLPLVRRRIRSAELDSLISKRNTTLHSKSEAADKG